MTKFYRIEDMEMLPTGISMYSFYVKPEGMDSFAKMMEKHSKNHFLSEPKLVDVEVDPEGGFLIPEGEKYISFFVGAQ